MWILQTENDVLIDDLELITASLLKRLTPPLTARQVQLIAAACLDCEVEDIVLTKG